MIAWLRWWLELRHARRYAYRARRRGNPMAAARASSALERVRMLRP